MIKIRGIFCFLWIGILTVIWGLQVSARGLSANIPFEWKARVDVNSEFTAMEAFCVDKTTNIAYCIKLSKKDRTKSRLYKIDMRNNSVSVMTNKDTGSDVIEGLGHANDMDIVTIGSKKYLFVVTMDDFVKENVTQSIMRIAINDEKNTWKMRGVGDCPIRLSGISFLNKLPNGNLGFIVKRGFDIYRIELNRKGTEIVRNVDVSERVVLSLEECPIEGITLPNINDNNCFLKQGMCYNAGKIYIPIWQKESSQNFIYAFDVDSDGTSFTYNEAESFSIKMKDVQNVEIESIVMYDDGKVLFNCNASKPVYYHNLSGWVREQWDFVGCGNRSLVKG